MKHPGILPWKIAFHPYTMGILKKRYKITALFLLEGEISLWKSHFYTKIHTSPGTVHYKSCFALKISLSLDPFYIHSLNKFHGSQAFYINLFFFQCLQGGFRFLLSKKRGPLYLWHCSSLGSKYSRNRSSFFFIKKVRKGAPGKKKEEGPWGLWKIRKRD